jgi:hypothetical protein
LFPFGPRSAHADRSVSSSSEVVAPSKA